MTSTEWELMELQLRNYVKDRQTMMLLLRVVVRCGDIRRGSGDHLENGGKTIFYLNVDEERANVAIVEDPLSWNEAMRSSMRDVMSKVKSLLRRMEKLRNSRVLQVFDYSQSGSVGSGALGCS